MNGSLLCIATGGKILRNIVATVELPLNKNYPVEKFCNND